MNLGQAIVSHIIDTGEIEPYLDRGLGERWLKDPDQGAESVLGPDTGNWFKAYQFLLEHFDEHGKVPSHAVFLDAFGNVRLTDQDNSASELLKLAERRISLAVSDALFDLIEDAHATGDLGGIEDALIDGVEILKHGIADDTVVTEMTNGDFDPVTNATRDILPGIPFGIPEIDAEYHGTQPGWLVTIVGRQKAKKSWFLFLHALAAWRSGRNVRVYSVELTNEEAWERIYSLALDLAPGKWLVPTEKRNERTWFSRDELRSMEDFRAGFTAAPNTLTVTQVDWGTTTKTVIRDVRRNQTDLVCFDGSYELSDGSGKSSGSDWQAQDTVARDLKRLALRTKITVATTTQSQEKQQGSKKKPGIKTSSVQAGSAYNRYSDLMIGLDYEDDGDKSEIYLTNMLSRRNSVPEVILTWNFTDGCHADARMWEGGYDGNADMVSRFTDELDDASPLAGTSARKRTTTRADEDTPEAELAGAGSGRRVVRRGAS